MNELSIGVVGTGRVGAVLAHRLRAAGHVITPVSGRSDASALRAATLLPGVEVVSPEEVVRRSDIVILAVPDDALIRLAEELVATGAVREGQVVAHTSGRHGLDALAAVTRAGARAIALHPAMTFTGTDIDLGRSCVFGLTALEADRALAERLVADLGGTPVWVPEAQRALYHAGLAHGANHLVTLVSQSMDLLRRSGAQDPAAVLRPLLAAALDNALSFGDDALTGPVVRGDVTTVQAHVDALAANNVPDSTLDAYLEMARATASHAVAGGRLAPSGARDVRRVLTEAEWDAQADILVG